MAVKCEQCGAPFEPAKPWGRFCSALCRLQRYRSTTKRPKTSLEVEMRERIAELEAGADLRDTALKHARWIADNAVALGLATSPSKRNDTKEPRPLLDRYKSALESGKTVREIALRCGLKDGTQLSKWRAGARPLSPVVERRLQSEMDRLGIH